jgi:GAF domain-containing protein
VAELETEPDLRRQLERLQEQQRALGRILRAIARSEGLQTVLDEIVEASIALCGGDHARIYLLEDGALRAFANYGSKEGYDYDLEHPHPVDRGSMAGRAALERAPVQIPDVLADPDYTYEGSTLAFRAGVAVPILLDDELLGSLVVVRREPGSFSDDEVQLVQAFADQAAVAIRNARVLERLQRRLDQQQAIGGVLRAIARSASLQTVLDEIVETVTRLGGGDNVRMWLLRDGLLHAVANGGWADGWDYDREHPHAIEEGSASGRAALTKQTVHIPDITTDPNYTYDGPVTFRANLSVPILLDDELIGVFGIVREEPKPFSTDAIDLVETFAAQAAVAIANARLIDAIEKQLEQQRAISDVLSAVARSEGLESVLHALVESACRLCDANFGEVYLAEGDVLRIAVGHGGPPELYEYEREHPHPIEGERKSVNGRVLLTQDVVHIPDILEDEEYSWSAANEAGIRVLLGAPLLVEGQLVGVFNIVRTDPRPFAEGEIDLLRTFADQAAIAVANARLMEAVERQRTELSRFVSPQVAELVSSGEGEKMLAGHRAYISALFCDLRGFTAFVETAAPEELFEVLREYHGTLGELIPEYEGTLEHFAGDGLMVFFNDPLPVEDHELKAIRLGLAARERFEGLASRWRRRGIELGLGIGISAGYATLGRIGFEGRYDYGALGPDTNLASRLSSHAEPGQILISQRVYAAVEEAVEATEVGELELKGFGRPVPAFEVRALRA